LSIQARRAYSNQLNKMRAIKGATPTTGKASVVSDAPIPTLRPDYINIKTMAVALNPTDWKHITFVDKPTTIGCDYAGIVEEVGSAVTQPFKKGDRVAGFVHGGNLVHLEDGAFGEHLTAKGDIQIKIPDNVSFEEAATLGVGITTVGQALYQALALPLPDTPSKHRFPILIYGGSTATGALAIQFAKLSGLEVVTTCGEHNFGYVKGIGADAAFDYKSSSVGEDIRKYTGNRLYHAFDCISEGASPQICADALSTNSATNKPKYTTLLPVKNPRGDVELITTLAYTAVGEDFHIRGMDVKAKKDDLEFATKFWQLSSKLLAEEKFRVHQIDLRSGGLDGILQGLDDLRYGRVSGRKLVYRLSDEK
jgi:NADPH:quinone reductase-like Zn-dependent oxidoreductase